jgi:hypothetical protein
MNYDRDKRRVDSFFEMLAVMLAVISMVMAGLILVAYFGFVAGAQSGSPMSVIEDAVFNISNSHEYINDSYVCNNFTIDAIKAIHKLNLSNVQSYYVRGCPENSSEDNPCHAWIRVAIDYDVTGGVFSPNYSAYSEFEVFIIDSFRPRNETWYQSVSYDEYKMGRYSFDDIGMERIFGVYFVPE